MNIKKSVIALTLASSLVMGAGAALAQDDTTPPTTETQPGYPGMWEGRGPRGGSWGPNFGERGPRGDAFGFRGGMRGSFGDGIGVELLEEYTGLDRAAIRDAHMDGQTLAELIEANGQSVDDFIAAALASASERIDAAVANDRITETVAAEMKDNVEERLSAMVNGEMPQRMPPVPADDAAAAEDADA